MNLKSISLLLIAMFLLPACNDKEKSAADKANNHKTIPYYDYEQVALEDIPEHRIKEKKFVLLDDSQYPLQELDKIKIFGNHIYVVDNKKEFLKFSDDGVFISKIGNRGQGPGEYIQISDFTIDKNENVHLLDGNGSRDRVFIYNTNGEFQSSHNLPFEADILTCIANGGYLFGLASWNNGQGKGYKVATTTSNFILTDSILPYGEFFDPNMWFSAYRFINASSGIFYNQTIDNSVYKFDEAGKLAETVEIDFGNRNVPNSDKTDIESKLEAFNDYTLLINFTATADDLIIGTIREGKERKAFILDTAAKKRYESSIDGYNHAWFDMQGNKLVSYLSSDISENTTYPDAVIKHLKDGGHALMIYTLNVSE
ncbi:MAG: 6-bladed beta-propeller [Tannerellaceae bacterium]